ncbi:MAG: PQQ-dependent sugar dehydrogenase, partial [Thermoanaerobaculia bacterium]
MTSPGPGNRPLGLGLALAASLLLPGDGSGATLPPGFQESVVMSGLTNPTVVQFASDGRVFIAEKSGVIKVFDNLSDTTPTIFADLRTQVHNYWDRGLLGIALHPNFPATPHVYVLYTHDAAIGATAPRWGTAGAATDGCPTPPGPTADGCVVSGRLSRLVASGDVMTGSEQVLIEDWFQQYQTHSVGSLAFGPDGALYASAGDGASATFLDYGQDGDPINPGGDPPVPVGGVQTPPSAAGGSLRSQDLRTSGDPATLDGTIVRIDPATGAAMSGNPLFGSPDANASRVIAYGLRNPFRLTFRPGTDEIWIGDVGAGSWEEINRIPDANDSVIDNFGWPCHYGPAAHPGFDSLDLTLCENLYSEPESVTVPYHAYSHSQKVVPGEPCPTGSSAISGMAFYGSGTYPAAYNGALFFADYGRDCIWAMLQGGNGHPDPKQVQTFVSGAANPVDLKIGPCGDLFYLDLTGGKLRRIQFFASNQPPVAVIQASPQNGPIPLTVNFDGSGSSDPNPGDTLSFAWDLDGDGDYDDSTSVQPTKNYGAPGNVTVRLRVTDQLGASSTTSVLITPDNTPPVVSITSPASGTSWKVGDVIAFSGAGNDAQDGSLPASALTWSLVLQHCPGGVCHVHLLQDFPGVASGSFAAPDHEYPSHLELH